MKKRIEDFDDEEVPDLDTEEPEEPLILMQIRKVQKWETFNIQMED